MVTEHTGSIFERLLHELPDEQKGTILTAAVMAGSILEPRLGAIELRLESLESGFERIESRLEALESGQERIEGTLAEILQEIKSV